MFDTVSDRMPRTPRRQLSEGDFRSIDRFVKGLDIRGANSRTVVRDASNDQLLKLGVA